MAQSDSTVAGTTVALDFFDHLARYLWVTRDSTTATTTEVVRPFLMVVNTFVILSLMVVVGVGIVWHYRSPKGERFHPSVVRGFLWPFLAACLVWVGQYLVLTPDLARAPAVSLVVSKLFAEAMSTLAGLGILAAGLTLLRLPPDERAHDYLPDIEVEENWPSGRTRRWLVRGLIASAAILVIADWSFLAAGIALKDSSFVDLGTVLGTGLSCLSLITLGLGLLRELNKASADALARTAGWSMVLYGAIQVLSIDSSLEGASRHMPATMARIFHAFVAKTEHLTLATYSAGIFFKFILASTLFGFFVMAVEARRAGLSVEATWRRLLVNQNYVPSLMARQMNARHNMVGAVGILRSIASRQLRNDLQNADAAKAWSRVMEVASQQEASVTSFLNFDPQRVKAPKIEAHEIVRVISAIAAAFERRGSYETVELRGGLPAIKVAGPLEEIREILHRVLENGPRMGARRAIVDITMDRDLLVVTLSNDGPAFPPAKRDEVFLRRKGGLWAAQVLALAHGGDVAIVSDPRESPVFRVRLPIIAEETPDAAEAQAHAIPS